MEGGSIGEGIFLVSMENLLVSYSPDESNQVRVLLSDQLEGDRVSTSSQQVVMPGLELVPFVEGEPIPLNWSQELVDDGIRGPHVAGKVVELIVAFSKIVGVSCEGYTEKLKAVFAHILVEKANKVVSKAMGGKKSTRELINLISLVNYEGSGGSVSGIRTKGRGNRIIL